jgi:HEAT repeat protein
VVIRRSSSGDVQPLIADLLSEEPGADVRRETAIARLRVIGPRAVSHLLTLLAAGSPAATRVAAFRALEGRRESRVAAPALAALDDPDAAVRTAALGVARGLLDGPRGHEVLDRVAALALDGTQPQAVRHAAIAALSDLPPRTLQPLVERLMQDPDAAVRAAVERHQVIPVRDATTVLADAAAGHLPADSQYLLAVLAETGGTAPLPTLHRLVGVVRERERSEARASRGLEWLTVRGAVHHALARRDSRVALYDLREAFEAAEAPLPDAFLSAVADIGDGGCLEAIAAAFARSAGGGPSRAWHEALAAAARAIVGRERLTRRHAVIKRLRSRHGTLVEPLLG